MIELIVNADDFGYSEAVNYGIIRAHTHGVLNSATVMMNMPGAEHALELSKKYPDLGLGVHLVLTCGKPLLQGHRTIVQPNGSFYKSPTLLFNEAIDTEEVKKEWVAQIERFLSLGGRLTHLDSHHHVHGHPELQAVIAELANSYHVPVRIGRENSIPGTTPFSTVFAGDFYGDGVSEQTLTNIISNAKYGDVVEIMTHPGYLDSDVLEGSSYHTPRTREVDVLTSWKLPSHVTLKKWN